ncbi:MAG: amino acid ABC transporter substrate-binding protein [Gammaproteobacteria bacterium]|nr:amino acid ABC transporter substrate-binding protein [Gammaproteobacteria bacterium]
MHMKRPGALLWSVVLTFALGLVAPASSAGTAIDAIKARGSLRCGVSEGIPGFSQRVQSRWQGLDVDYCRALAMALLADPDAVEFLPLDVQGRFEALRDGRIDVLSRNSTWTLSREADYGISFVGILFFDGQGFLARRDGGARYALELGGARICVKPGTTSERKLANYFATQSMQYEPVPVADFEAMKSAFEGGACDVVSSDQSQLHALRISLGEPSSARVLPEFISKEPLSPAVRNDDADWALLARLVLAVLVNAEEAGVDSANVKRIAGMARSQEIRGLLDLDGRFSKRLGLADGWAPGMLEKLGNYAEIFERNLGAGSELGLKRGQNALWSVGGLLYAPRID